MKNCVSCEKKAIFYCNQCMIYMCKAHRLDHLDAYQRHTFKKYKKILPEVKSKIDPCMSKMNGLKQSYNEIIDSDSVLTDKVNKARSEAIKKIETERKQLLKLIAGLGNRLTEEQTNIFEEATKALQVSLLLYQGQTPRNIKKCFTWYQAEILEEKEYTKFHYSQDTEEFQVIHCMASIKSQELDFISSDADRLKFTSMLIQREQRERESERESERERILPMAKEKHEKCLLINSAILKLDRKVKEYIKKASVKEINAINILNDEQYIPRPNSLESELSAIYQTIQECVVIVNTKTKMLLNFISEPKAENISEEISTFNQTEDLLQKDMELCNNLLALLKQSVFNYWQYYIELKASKDESYYFICE